MVGSRSVALAFAISVIAAPALAQQSFTLKIVSVTQNDPTVDFMKMYKEKIEARTNGRIKAELYPAAQLGGIPQLVQGILLGTIEMYATPPTFFKGADIRYTVTDAPGLFDSIEHGHRSINDPEFREPYVNAGAAKGVRGISVFMYGGTAYATTFPLRRLDDFKGKKFRVLASAIETGVMREVGAAGIPMDFAEILPALQNKTIDGVRSNASVMGGAKFFTVAKFLNNLQDTMIPSAGMASVAWLDKLPADLRKAVEDVGRECDEAMLKVAQDYAANAAKLWADNGAEVSTLSAEEKAEFMKRARSVGDQVLGGDPQTRDLYNTLKRVADKHRKRS
jgi:C4-dicarboxylate-binding protein DctP